MEHSRVALEITGGIARIALVNPAARNAIDLRFCEEFAAVASRCAATAGLKAALITAQGEVFSVGGDIREFVAQRDRIHQHVLAMAARYHEGVAALYHLAVPVVVALNGMAAGGGFSIVCAADIAIAKRSARLNPAYTRTGLTPDGGGTWFLSRIVGPRKAFEIFSTNPTLTADEARELGIVARVVDDERFDHEIEALIRQLADIPSDALVALKRLIRSGTTAGLEEHLRAEASSIAAQTARASTMERLVAFLSRGK